MSKKLGVLLVVAALAACAGEAGPAGPRGETGETGATGQAGSAGEPGEAGDSVMITELAVGDESCPGGGTAFEVGGEVSYACNGEAGGVANDIRDVLTIGLENGTATFEEFSGLEYGVEVLEMVNPTNGEITLGAGSAKYSDITLKRGLFEDATPLMLAHETGQPAAIDALRIINRATSAPIAEFTAMRVTVPDIIVEGSEDGVWIDNVTLVPGSISLASTDLAPRDGEGNVRITAASGPVGVYDVVRFESTTASTYEPIRIIKRIDKSSPLVADLNDVLQSGPTPETMTIEVLDAAGATLVEFQLEDAWPSNVRWTQGGDGLWEEVTLATTGISTP